MHFPIVALSLLICLSGDLHAQATFLYSENSSGDLGQDHLNPTVLSLSEGGSFLQVSVNRFDTDLFSLIIPMGLQMDSLTLRQYTSSGMNTASFLGFQENRLTLAEAPSSSFGGDINFTLPGTTRMNEDLLPSMLLNNMALDAPLPEGNYAFWVNETSLDVANMIFEFQASEVPEPSSTLLMLGGLLLMARRRRY